MLKENLDEFVKSNIPKWNAAGYTGKGITIAVLDDGGHPSADMDYVSIPLNDSRDDKYHAVQVARVIHEIAPDARIILLNYFKSSKATTDWILEHRDEIDLINCSFTSRLPNQHFERLKETEIPVICASGNDGEEDGVDYPARLPWTIAVGAWREKTNERAHYSNGGAELDCVDYTDIYVPTGNPKHPVMLFNGTSCSTPSVVAKVALWLQSRKDRRMPRHTTEEVRSFIKKNAKDYGSPGRDNESGYGLFILPENVEPYRLKIELFIGKKEAIKDGQSIILNMHPILYEDRTMLGIRDIAELLGLQVTWIADEQKVVIEA